MIEVFNEINKHIIKGIMLHEQWADMFDFLNLRGFKRQQEYYFLLDNVELRGIHRYAINHDNKMIKDIDIEPIREIPDTWYNYTKFDVDTSTRRQYVKDIFTKWISWLNDLKKMYEDKFKMLTENKEIACANKVNELVKRADMELKKTTRQMLEYQSVDWDMEYLMWKQDCLHEEYAEKEKDIHVDIC